MTHSNAYPIPSSPTTCTRMPSIVKRHWRFGEIDPASEGRNPRGRITAWCVQCGELLEVQEEGTGTVIFSGFPHRAGEVAHVPTSPAFASRRRLPIESLRLVLNDPDGNALGIWILDRSDDLWVSDDGQPLSLDEVKDQVVAMVKEGVDVS